MLEFVFLSLVKTWPSIFYFLQEISRFSSAYIVVVARSYHRWMAMNGPFEGNRRHLTIPEGKVYGMTCSIGGVLLILLLYNYYAGWTATARFLWFHRKDSCENPGSHLV